MLTLSIEDIVLFAALWLAFGLISALVFIRFAVLHWGGQAVINKLMNPDDETKAAIASLVGMLLSTPIETGKVIIDPESGKESKEVKPLFVFMGQQLVRQFELYLRAKSGGNKSGMEKAAGADPELAAMMQGNLLGGLRKRRKDEGIVEYLLETIATSPQGQEMIGKVVESKLGSILPK